MLGFLLRAAITVSQAAPSLTTAPLASATSASPALRSLDPAEVAPAFRPEPSYKSTTGGPAHVRIVGAYEIVLPPGRSIAAATSPGYLPMLVRTDQGSCSLVSADYIGGKLTNATVTPAECTGAPTEKPATEPPPEAGLCFLDRSWGYHVWADEERGETVLTAPRSGGPVILRIGMRAVAVRAMTSPDAPMSDLTAVGVLNGRTVLVTFDLTF